MSFSQNRAGLTKQKNNDEVLRQQFLKAAILDNTEQSFVLIDRDMNILTFNDIAKKNSIEILDANLEEGVGILELVKPEDIENFKSAFTKVLAGERINYERHYKTDKIEKWFSCTLYPILDNNSDILGVCFSALDITVVKQTETELRKSMDKYRTAIDFTYDWEFWQSPEGNYIYVSPSCERITGYSAEEFMDNPLLQSQITHPADRQKVAEHLERELKDASYNDNLVFRIIDRQGKIKWISHFCQAVYDSENNYAGRRGSQREVTDRIKADQKLKQLNQKLSISNQQLQSFVSFTTHDLRSPLVNIKGFAGELTQSIAQLKSIVAQADMNQQTRDKLSKLIDQDMAEDVRFINHSADSMEVMIAGLKKLSQPGMMDLKIEQLDVNKLVQEVVDSMKFEITTADAQVEFDSLPDCMADENMLSQIFSNLISNAVKYRSQQRQCRIKITGKQNRQMAYYKIEDNGIGIDKDNLGLIFEPFKRLNNHHSIKGDGLGLAIVKKMLERQGGSIKVESIPDKGTAFTVSLLALREIAENI